MARLFVAAGTDEFLEVDSAIITAPPFTIVAWAKAATLGGPTAIFHLADKDGPADFWQLGIDASNVGRWRSKRGSGVGEALSVLITVDVWQHSTGVEITNVDRCAYLSGANKGTNTTDEAPVGVDRTSIARAGDSTPGNFWDGDIGHVAAYLGELSADVIATLAAGFNPRRVQIDNLVGYWPVNGQSPEYNVVGSGVNLIVNGTPLISEEPPIRNFIQAPP